MKIELTKDDAGYEIKISEGYRDVRVKLASAEREATRDAFIELLTWCDIHAAEETLPTVELQAKAEVN